MKRLLAQHTYVQTTDYKWLHYEEIYKATYMSVNPNMSVNPDLFFLKFYDNYELFF